MHAVSNPIIQTSRVQGHPGSKFIVQIESQLMVCCLTSFKSNIVSVTTFQIFAAKIPDLDVGRFKVIQDQSSWCQSIAHGWFPIDFHYTVIVSVTIFAIFDVQFWWPWSRLIQVYPGSEYIGPIERPMMVSSLNSFESNTVSVFIFEIFGEKVLWPRSRTVQGHRRSKVILPVDSPSVISYSTSIDYIISYLLPVFKYLTYDLMTLNQHSSRSSKVKG